MKTSICSKITVSRRIVAIVLLASLMDAGWTHCVSADETANRKLHPVVEAEEDVYSYTSAGNGAGPMWCAGSTCLTRVKERVFATGLETVPGAQPLNNCRWVLFERKTINGSTRWVRTHVDDGRTREPAPIAAFHNGQLWVSGNPTLAKSGAAEPGGGPTKPELWKFPVQGGDQKATSPARILPAWNDSPSFSEHSYRSLATDGARGELVLFQNIGYGHAEWTFLNANGQWSAHGRITWPFGDDYENPKPTRLCYPNVALQNRAVHFFGVGDITEPVAAWQSLKHELTGSQWDYVFRRLYYTWTPDITKGGEPFAKWIQIADRESTAGHLWPCDMWLAPGGSVHLLWTERAVDERLRAKFFPQAKQSRTLMYAILRDGKVIRKSTLMASTEERPGLVASRARLHATPGNRLFVVSYVTGTDPGSNKAIAENRIAEIRDDGKLANPVRIPLKHPIPHFFTATPRAGSPPSNVLELLGPRSGKANTIGYARVRLF